MSFFTVEQLSAGYGSREVVHSLSFAVERGCLMGILGANGSGKTTLLQALCGVLPHRGRCMLAGRVLERLSPRQIARECSYIPQRSGISVDISALDVVLMGFNPRLGLLEGPTASMQAQARAALARVGLAGREEESYLALSEGQKQLCILARTLCADGRLMLLDEPESALDFRFRDQLMAHVRRWVQEGERAAVVTLHDPALALNACDALLVLEQGRGVGVIHPAKDALADMERMLARIYGAVSLNGCRDRAGRAHLIMLKEQEECP